MEAVLWPIITLLCLACLALAWLYLHWRRDCVWWRDYARWLLEHHMDAKAAARVGVEARPPESRAPAPVGPDGGDDDEDPEPHERWPL